MIRAHRNISFAAVESFETVLHDGALVTVRGSDTKTLRDTMELRNRVTVIERPMERCVFLPRRGNDIFGQVAETMWVIGGCNDVTWLSRYVHRATNYSDDGGQTWRAAYGPRLRNWEGRVDQLDEWRRLLLSDRSSRRTVGVLFDPAKDFVSGSKDIPCNNWLNWLIRDDKLHLTVGIRSNDAMWGFSGINAFEWSVLQQMMACWVGANVGDVTYIATSYHIYSDYLDRAKQVVDHFYGLTPYEYGIAAPPFLTPWDRFGAAMADWFEIEEQIRRDPDAPLRNTIATTDPFLAGSLRLLRLKWGAQAWSADRLAEELASSPEDDFTAAAYDKFGRKRPELLGGIPQSGIRAFFDACEAAKTDNSSELKKAVKHLQARKNASYAGAWKRRGERVSVLPNVARKVDRLQAIVDCMLPLEGETTLDTVLDLYVYCVKYRLFLSDEPGADVSFLPRQAPAPFSDFDINFDALVDTADFTRGSSVTFSDQVSVMTAKFEEVWRAVDRDALLYDRQSWATELANMAELLVNILVMTDQRSIRDFVRKELRSS